MPSPLFVLIVQGFQGAFGFLGLGYGSGLRLGVQGLFGLRFEGVGVSGLRRCRV